MIFHVVNCVFVLFIKLITKRLFGVYFLYFIELFEWYETTTDDEPMCRTHVNTQWPNRLLNINWKLRVQRSFESAIKVCVYAAQYSSVPYGSSRRRYFANDFSDTDFVRRTLFHSRYHDISFSLAIRTCWYSLCLLFGCHFYIFFDSLFYSFQIFSRSRLHHLVLNVLWRKLSLNFSFDRWKWFSLSILCHVIILERRSERNFPLSILASTLKT